eukprot:3140105-Alexandrium_andersonii.AAC.1
MMIAPLASATSGSRSAVSDSIVQQSPRAGARYHAPSSTGLQSQCTRCHARSAVGEASAGAMMSAAPASANVRALPPCLSRSRRDT